MGISTRAYGGIGILLWMNDIQWPTVTEESCQHPERVGNTFCPICGTKVETRVEETGSRDNFVEAFQETNPDKTHFIAETVSYEEGRYGDNSPRNHGVFIGYGAVAGGYGSKVYKSRAVPDVQEVRDTLVAWERAAFQWLKDHDLEPPNSIFEAGDYGLHVIDYVSY